MFNYKNININYIRYGNPNKQAVVLLNGWGQNIEMMKPVGDRLTDYDVIIIDLPGHGKSEEPKEIWSLQDFVSMIHALLESLKIQNPILIGHSFGGKLSLLYASTFEVKKLVLLASPFKVKKNPNSLKVKALKKLKTLPGLNKLAETMKKHMGSTDYRNASPMMRAILVKHVNTDITENVKKIKCPTIIIWGTNDAAVPIEDAYELESLIKDAAVIPYEGCTHYAYLERLYQTVSIIRNFIKEK